MTSEFDKNILTSKEYFEQMLFVFPSLAEKLESDDGDHFKMERFSSYVIEQIDAENWGKLKACFAFQEERISIVCPEIENALNVSFCESILCHVGKNANWLFNYMGPLLITLYKSYEEYYVNLWKKRNG